MNDENVREFRDSCGSSGVWSSDRPVATLLESGLASQTINPFWSLKNTSTDKAPDQRFFYW